MSLLGVRMYVLSSIVSIIINLMERGGLWQIYILILKVFMML